MAFNLSLAKVSMLLLKKHIKNCLDCKSSIAEALKSLKAKEPYQLLNSLLKWEEQDRLIYYKEKIYIPNNKELCGNIVKFCHNFSATEHPSKHSALALVSHLYW
jgi:hypothetical protein